LGGVPNLQGRDPLAVGLGRCQLTAGRCTWTASPAGGG